MASRDKISASTSNSNWKFENLRWTPYTVHRKSKSFWDNLPWVASLLQKSGYSYNYGAPQNMRRKVGAPDNYLGAPLLCYALLISIRHGHPTLSTPGIGRTLSSLPVSVLVLVKKNHTWRAESLELAGDESGLLVLLVLEAIYHYRVGAFNICEEQIVLVNFQ